MDHDRNQGVCVVIGAGPGNGAAIGRRFSAAGRPVALCARDEARLQALAATIDGARAYRYDVCEVEAPPRVFARIRAQLGGIETLVYNAGAGAFANVDDATLEGFQRAWEVNARGLFLAVREVLPDLRAAGGGNLVVIGATASLKGGANFTPFASAKFAQRGLAQSLARHLGPERIHVSYVIIDGILDLERARKRLPDKPASFFMDPARIADAVYFLSRQDPQAWTFELDLRPYAEKW